MVCETYRLCSSVTHRYGRLFIVDGVISLPIAIAGFFFLADVPETSRAWYLTNEVRKSEFQENDRTLAYARIRTEYLQ